MKRFFVRYGFNQSHAIASDLSKAEASRTFGTPEHLAALVFVAFTYESALNHLGQLAFPTWDEHFDRLSPEAKLALLTDKGRLAPDYTRRPYQSFSTVFKVRNGLAHPKVFEAEVTEEQLQQPDKWPRPKWIAQANTLDVARALADLDEVVQALQNALQVVLPPKFLLGEVVQRAPAKA